MRLAQMFSLGTGAGTIGASSFLGEGFADDFSSSNTSSGSERVLSRRILADPTPGGGATVAATNLMYAALIIDIF